MHKGDDDTDPSNDTKRKLAINAKKKHLQTCIRIIAKNDNKGFVLLEEGFPIYRSSYGPYKQFTLCATVKCPFGPHASY